MALDVRRPRVSEERRKFLEHNVLATGSTLIGGVCGLLLQAVSSHALQPAQFGKAFAVYSFYALVTRPSSAFGRLQAWQTSRELATTGELPTSGALLRQQTVWLMAVGSAVAVAFALAGPLLGGYLHVPVSYIAIGGASIPFLLAVQPLLGILQGRQRFVPWSVLSILVNLSRLVLIAAFVFPLGAIGFLLANTLAAAVTFLWCLWIVRDDVRRTEADAFHWRASVPFMVTGVVSTYAMGVFQGVDVIQVEHFFAKVPAGQYAAVASVSSSVFFASGGVASVVFPMIAMRHARGRRTFGVMGAAFALVGLAGGVGTLLLQVFGHQIMIGFAGHKYLPGVHYLALYGLGMALLAWISVLTNTLQSLNSLAMLWILIPAAVARPVLLILFHRSLMTVVVIGDLAIGAFALALTALYVVSELRLPLVAPATPAVADPVAALADPAPAVADPVAALVEPVAALVGVVEDPGPAGPPGNGGADPGLRLLTPRWRPTLQDTWVVGTVIGVLGLVVRHGWLSTLPLSSGDWKWPGAGRIGEWFPWPSLWNDVLGLSGQNRFEDAFRFPVYAVNGTLGAAGATWTVIEKVVYFVPFAVLLPVAGWLLAREVLDSSRWALLAPVLLLGNSYFLIESNGEVPLVLAEAIGCLAMVAFIRAMRRSSLRWALAAGLTTAACCAMDLRPAYLTALMLAGYLAILVVAEPAWRLVGRRLVLGAVAGGVFVATQAFWILPLMTFGGHPSFPTPKAPDFTIITLGHGLAGVFAGWTGGAPAAFVEAPLNPMFMLLPIVAMLPLLWRRLRPEVVWLSLAAVVCSFLAKTNNPPFGGVYTWVYLHVPGFNLFREGSKFLFPVAIAYAVLIPVAFEHLTALVATRRERLGRKVFLVPAVLLGAVMAISVSTVSVLESGALGSTTTPAAEPRVFSLVSSLLASDHQPGSVLWFGGPVFVNGNTGEQSQHSYTIASATHPLDVLSGNAISTVVQDRDVLQYFCPVMTQAYCYVDPALFPYLTRMVGAGYVIAPEGPEAGMLPAGITRAWLAHQLTAMFGAPRVLGDPSTAMLVWHLPAGRPTITTYPTVALVDSGPWSLGAVVPALQAMGVPAAYRQSLDVSDYPVARATLPDVVDVLPLDDGRYTAPAPQLVGIMARTTSASLDATIGSKVVALPLLQRPVKLPGWGVYGPVTLAGGATSVTAAAQIGLGPAIAWSPRTAAALAPSVQAAGPTVVSANGERLVARLSGPAPGAWAELRRTYDVGWRSHGKPPLAVADGLFALYHPAQGLAGPAKLTFTFSTYPWERRGLVVSVAAVVLTVLAIAGLWRRRKPPVPAPVLVGRAGYDNPIASKVGALGVIFLVLSALGSVASWYGLPSRLPWSSVIPDPYAVDVVFGSVALGLLLLSLLLRIVGRALRPFAEPVAEALPVRSPRRPRPRRVAVGATLATGAMLLSSCGTTQSGSDALLNAQQAGASSRLGVGATLDEARIQLAAKDRTVCIAQYTKALKTFPYLPTAFAGRARCYQSGGYDFPAAVHDYSRALALAPGNPSFLLGRAAAHRGSGDTQAAVDDYRAAVVAPQSTPAEALTAVDGTLGIQDYVAAQSVLALAQRRYPSDPLVRLAVADVALAQGLTAQVGAELRQAAALAAGQSGAPDLPAVLSRVCNYQVLTQAYVDAAQSCRQGAQLSSDGSGSFDDLSVADAALGHLDRAISDLDDAVGAFQGSVGPSAQPAGVDGFGLAYLYEAQGRLYIEAHDARAATVAYTLALGALPPRTPDFRARLKSDLAAARRD